MLILKLWQVRWRDRSVLTWWNLFSWICFRLAGGRVHISISFGPTSLPYKGTPQYITWERTATHDEYQIFNALLSDRHHPLHYKRCMKHDQMQQWLCRWRRFNTPFLWYVRFSYFTTCAVQFRNCNDNCTLYHVFEIRKFMGAQCSRSHKWETYIWPSNLQNICKI